MNTLKNNNLDQLQQDLRLLQTQVDILRSRLNNLFIDNQLTSANIPKSFIDLEGFWPDVTLSMEDIQSAEYKVGALK